MIALNVDKVNVEFFRIKQEALTNFLAQWGRASSLDTWQSRELLPMAELVYSGRFDLNPARNTRETVLLPIAGLEPFKQPGVYLAVMRQAGTYNYSQPATLFTLSDIGLSVHRYHGRLDAFAQALEGGKALSGVDVEVLGYKGEVLASVKTDGDGHAQLPLPEKATLLIARQGEQTSLLNLSSPALDLAEFDIGGAVANPLQFFVFGPRDLYRPGELVLLNALLRDVDGRSVKPQPVNVEVRRPDEQVSRKFVWEPGANGLYQYQLQLAGEAPTGRWQLLFDFGGGRQQIYEFLVEDFLPERLALELKGSEKPLKPSDEARFQVEGRYLYGAPASGNRLTGQVYVRPLREAVKTLPGYQFGSVTEEELSQDLELEETTLDAEGLATVGVENRWAEAKSPLQLILQASLQESGGRPITRRLVQPVWPAERLPGLRGLFDGENVDGDGLAEFEVLLADPAGNKLASDSLQVRLIRERRDYYWSFSESEGWNYHYNEKFLNLGEERVKVAAGGTAKISFPVEWGPYRVEVTDPQTGFTSSLRFWAGYYWQDNTEGGAVRPDQVKLAPDKPAYGAGDTAKVTVTPPAGGSGYLMVESSDGPLWWQEIEVPAEGKSFDVPLAKDWARHDLYVSALVIRPGERKAGATPKRAVGLLHLPFDRAPRKLQVSLEAPEKMRPLQPLKVKVQAKNADGSVPEKVNVLVAAVDVGILNITEYKTPDPFAELFGRKAYGVDQLDVYGQLIEAGQGRLAKLAFGGDAALAKGGKRPDTSVTIVALQSVPIELNAQGEGDVSLDIPDFNGELRLMAQAWTDERYGMAEGKTVVAAPLVAELSAPRFLAGGDETSVALDLTNLSGADQQLEVRVEAEGQLNLAGNPDGYSTTLDLDQAQRDTLRIPVLHLFNPHRLLKSMQGWTEPLKYGVFVLPLLFAMALGILVNNFALARLDAATMLSGMGALGHVVFSLFTVNLLCTLTLALTAQKYRGTVYSLSLAFMLGFLPRFLPRIRHLVGLSRRERLWLHGGPVLMRLALFSLGVFTWYLTRASNGLLPAAGLALALTSAVALLLTLNPLSKSSGYHLIAVLVDEPQLRGKAFKALFGRIRGNAYREANDTALMAYGLASVLYSVLLFVVALMLIGSWLKVHFGGTGVLAAVVLIGYLSVLTYRKFKSANEMYERAVQFERWKRRRLPENLEQKVGAQPSNKTARYTGRVLALSLLICLFLPYPYEPGGSFVILPTEQQQVASDIGGIITEVLVEGGEQVKAGQVLARLATGDYAGHVKIAEARIAEEMATVAELKSRPRLEEVEVAQRSLDMARTQTQFSQTNHQRHMTLLAKGGVSAQQADQARRQYEVDLMAVKVAEANLALARTGATPDTIAAAEAQVQRWNSERDLYLAKIERSQLRAPMDGKLITLLLRQKVGKFQPPGEPFAVVEKADRVFAEIEVPETEIGYVQPGAVLKVKPLAYSERLFDGTVTQIDANVIEKATGKYVKVLTTIDNPAGELKSGMTGYAKAAGETLPVWKAFTRAIFRFIDVELWSWIP